MEISLYQTFLVKANLFNDFFSRPCTTVNNDSSIPPNITFATEQKLSTFEFCTDGIVRIIKSLDPNKAHGHDEISIRMIKLCGSLIAKPLNPCQFFLETVLKINVSLKNGRKPTLYLLIKKW